jgi:hypothetical protein
MDDKALAGMTLQMEMENMKAAAELASNLSKILSATLNSIIANTRA